MCALHCEFNGGLLGTLNRIYGDLIECSIKRRGRFYNILGHVVLEICVISSGIRLVQLEGTPGSEN